MKHPLPLLPLVLVTIVAVAACTGGNEGSGAGGDTPAGYERYDGEGFSFVHPAGWEVTEHEVDDGEAVSVSEDDESGVPFGVGFERGGRVPAEAQTFEDYVAQFDTLADLHLTDRETVRLEPIDVPGADDARLIESRYVWPEGDVEVRQYDVLLLQREREQIPVFRISAAAGRWDAEIVDVVLSSLSLEE